MSGMLKDAPGQLDQILLDLEQGNFEINARTPAIEQLERTLDRVGRALVYGLGVSALLLSASILIAAVVLDMGQRNTFSEGDIAATIIAGGSAMFAMMLLGGITWNLFLRGFLSKIRWARFLGLVPVIGKYFRGGTGDSNRSGR
jgi:Na+-transporting NADH:ubiquinone oxidoreductase subunit NqrE